MQREWLPLMLRKYVCQSWLKIPPSVCRRCRMRPHSLLVVIINHPESALNLISKTTTVKQVRDGIGGARLAKRSQSQRARIAVSTCPFRLLVARPGQVQRRAQFDSFLHYLRLSHRDHGRVDSDERFGFGAGVDHVLKRIVKLRTTVRI